MPCRASRASCRRRERSCSGRAPSRSGDSSIPAPPRGVSDRCSIREPGLAHVVVRHAHAMLDERLDARRRVRPSARRRARRAIARAMAARQRAFGVFLVELTGRTEMQRLKAGMRRGAARRRSPRDVSHAGSENVSGLEFDHGSESAHSCGKQRVHGRGRRPRRPGCAARGDAGLARRRHEEERREDARAQGSLLDLGRPGRSGCAHPGRREARLHEGPRPPGRVPLHARRAADDVPEPSLDDAHVRGLRNAGADERALQVPPRPGPDRPLDRLRFPHPHGVRLRLAALTRRGRHVRRRRRHAPRHGGPLPGHPARRSDDVDDDQRSGDRPPRLLHRARRRSRDPAHEDRRHGAERLPEGVHRTARVARSSPSGDAHRHGHDRVLLEGGAALEHRLDQRLSHPRSRSDGGPGARLHDRGRHRLRRVVPRARPRRRRLRPAPLLLLGRPQRLLRGDRQVPRRPPALGAPDEGALRREEGREHEAPDARADGGRLPHRPAAV